MTKIALASTTAALVTSASGRGLPGSTTPGSVGALLGIGGTTQQVQWKPVLGVLAAAGGMSRRTEQGRFTRPNSSPLGPDFGGW